MLPLVCTYTDSALFYLGGGPTGVEFAAELHDLIASDIARHYGHTLARMARINLYDVAPTILGTFDRGLAEYAEKKFSRDGIVMRLGHHVERVSDVGICFVFILCQRF